MTHAPTPVSREQFHVWSYKRPRGHSRSRAVLAGYAPLIEEWAFAPLSGDGVYWDLSRSVSGFPTKEAAEAAALLQTTGEK